MIDSGRHDSSSARAGTKWIRGDGMRAKLVRSHLTVALLGTFTLCIAMATVVWTRSTAARLAELDGPVAVASTNTLVGLQRSLAALRGWMTLGEESFRQERDEAWRNEIQPSLDRLTVLSRAAGNPEEIRHLQKVQELLQDLKEFQWFIEDVAHTPGNAPAQMLMIRNLAPIGEAIESAITSLLELEKKHEATAERKILLGRIADLRFAFASCRTSLSALVSEGNDVSRTKMRISVSSVNDHIGQVITLANLLAPDQRDLLDSIRIEFTRYGAFCDDIIAIPSGEWYVARHLLGTRAAPIAANISRTLQDISRRRAQSMRQSSTRLVGTTNVGLAMLGIMLVGMAVTALLLSLRGAKRILQPIELLANAAEDLSDGRAIKDIPVITADELGLLTEAFNTMNRTLQERQEALRESEARTRAIVDTAADGIITIDEKGVVQSFNSAAVQIFGYLESEAIGENVNLLVSTPLGGEHDVFLRRSVETGEQTVLDGSREVEGRRKGGATFPMTLSASEAFVGDRRLFTGIVRDITERKKAELELEALHQRLMTASRQAGMAEIATGVLHNVGNVLNSVNVSATVVADKLRKSKVPSLAKAVGLMRAHAHDLGTFITEDDKGKKLPAFLGKLAEHLVAEQESVMNELEELTKNIEHIKKIVSTQQSHGSAYGVVETASIPDVVDDALTVSATSFERYGIELLREYEELPRVALDKQQLLQILVNLIRNAKHAVADSGGEGKRLTLRIRRTGDARVCIDVIDNGIGITPENLTKIFSHGFTTKEDGHGFGLHSAALAAKGMGGSLSVHSDGLGTGAIFTLDLPLEPAAVQVQEADKAKVNA